MRLFSRDSVQLSGLGTGRPGQNSQREGQSVLGFDLMATRQEAPLGARAIGDWPTCLLSTPPSPRVKTL